MRLESVKSGLPNRSTFKFRMDCTVHYCHMEPLFWSDIHVSEVSGRSWLVLANF